LQKLFFISVILLITFFSCKKDDFTTNPNDKLTFSVDTVMFDTIFTTIGSTTYNFKVYNKNSKSIKLDKIKLARGNDSPYRLNINGYKTNELDNVEIKSNDSIFIFVEVTIDPNRNKMIEQDSILFIYNGNSQDIDLVSFGQDVHLVNSVELTNDTTWTNNIPHLVYNYVYLDSSKTLTIEEGTIIYFHHNAGMFIHGTLVVNGTKDNPVIFRGDRLESFYDDVPGQWGGIQLMSGGGQSKINYAEIKNAIVGVQVGTLGGSSGESLTLTNTKIINMNYAGIYALASQINAFNCVVANCGFYNAALLVGGIYNFYHCSFANYWAYSNRSTPEIALTNNLETDEATYVGNLQDANFKNCIIHGNIKTEIGFNNNPSYDFNYFLENCLLKYDESELNISDATHYKNIFSLPSDSKLFLNTSLNDYSLDTISSYAKDKGSIDVLNNFSFAFDITKDIEQNDRTNDAAPDLGAYELIQN